MCYTKPNNCHHARLSFINQPNGTVTVCSLRSFQGRGGKQS
jgi:hypothetical protein